MPTMTTPPWKPRNVMLVGGSIVIGIQLLSMLLMWNKFQSAQDLLAAKQESLEAQSMRDSRLRSEIQVALSLTFPPRRFRPLSPS